MAAGAMSRPTAGVGASSAVLAAIDLVLIRLWAAGDLSTPDTLTAHAGTTAVIGGVALALGWRERVQTASSLLVCLLLGPIGGFVLLIADLGRGAALAPVARQMPRAVPPSRAELLHAQILQGRRRRAGAAAPERFADVFASGTLARQQEAIAAISLDYRPEMLPALRLALTSEVPALRVQAAAVYAKLRGSFGDRAKAVLAAALDGRLAPRMAAEAEAVAASGFVDAETAAELRALAAQAAPAPPAAPRRRENALARPPRLHRHACGGVA
jgi:hypothetical protein